MNNKSEMSYREWLVGLAMHALLNRSSGLSDINVGDPNSVTDKAMEYADSVLKKMRG